MLEFQQNEKTAERRRWILVLVDSADGVTGKTGQTGQVYVSKNGGTPALSVNSIVEVDSTNMPGHYYIELTQSELDTLGFISITKKTGSTLAFHDRGLVSYNDPYVMAGGFSGGDSGPAKVTPRTIKEIAEAVWKYMVDDKEPAMDIMKRAADHPAVDFSPITEKIEQIPAPVLDLEPVLSRIDNIQIPKPIDYTTMFKEMQEKLDNFGDMQVVGLSDAINNFTKRMDLATEDINTSLVQVKEIREGFDELKVLVDKFNESLSEATDMDRRFESMTSIMQERDLEQLSANITQTMNRILTAVTDVKYDILQEINPQQ